MPQRPAIGGKGRPGTRLASAAFDGGQERRLLAADKSACSLLDMEMEADVRSQDVIAQKAVVFGLGDRDFSLLIARGYSARQ